MQHQLLHAPIGGLGDVDFILRRASKRVAAGELLELAAGAADYAQYLAVERQLEDTPREGRFAEEQHLVRAGGDAERIRCPDRLREARAGRGGAIDGMRSGDRRYVDGEHAQELAFRVEDLDAV